MRNSQPRVEVGESDLGTVFIHSFEGTPENGKMTEAKFEVRAGNHTIATRGSFEEAEVIANAMVLPHGTVEQPEPALETEATVTSSGVKAGTKKK